MVLTNVLAFTLYDFIELCSQVVMLRFGHDWSPECMRMDETLFGISDKVKNFATIFLVRSSLFSSSSPLSPV